MLITLPTESPDPLSRVVVGFRVQRSVDLRFMGLVGLNGSTLGTGGLLSKIPKYPKKAQVNVGQTSRKVQTVRHWCAALPKR